MPDASLVVPSDAWEPTGDGRFLATVYIAGTPHHLEAIPYQSPRLERFRDAFEPDGQWQTVKIGRRRYVLLLEPFSV